MSYSIQYNPENNRKYPLRTGIRGKPVRLLSVLLLIILAVGFITIDGGSKLKSWLLPGDPIQTEAALHAFVEDIREGESFPDAVTLFCQEIVDHAAVRN